MTAGQISGPKTPSPHRQQELWDTVFGENDDTDDEEERGRPIWLFALVASMLLALAGALVWAFTAGPLGSAADGADRGSAAASAKPSSSTAAARPAQLPGLPTYEGPTSPVNGAIIDRAAGITLPRLGGPWRADPNAQNVQSAYGFATRQYVNAGTTAQDTPEYAQVMSGPLPESLAAKYTASNQLSPVINAVMLQARQSLLPKGNKATKVAQQRLYRNGLTGQLAVYRVTADTKETTVVVAAVNTGADLPSIVYMAVPAGKRNLLPDINTVFRSIRPIKQSAN